MYQPRRGNPRGFHNDGGRGGPQMRRNLRRGNNADNDENNDQRGPKYNRRNWDRYEENDQGRSQNSRNIRRNDIGNQNSGRNFRQTGGVGEFRRPCGIGFKMLEGFLEKDLENLTLELLNNRFEKFINGDVTHDAIVLIVKILSKVCDSNFDTTKTQVLQLSLNEKFVDTLTKYIAFLPLQTTVDKYRNKYFWKDTDEFWNNLIKLCEEVLNTTPTHAVQILPKLLQALSSYIPIFQELHKQHVSDDTVNKIKKLHEVVKERNEEYEKEQQEKLKNKMSNMTDEEEPPDNFREITVYPIPAEIVGQRGFLRSNVVKGPYKDVNHYLDVQFRLLREDFVGPLRKGIASFRSPDKKKTENVRVHKRVCFLNAETINERFCIRMQFDFNKKKKKDNSKYENSRRFMFGSLLCFTPDNFRSLLFGRVAERKLEDLEKGQLIVAFDENVTVLLNVEYLMVECSVYFEPYFHVLNVLKNMSVENFPMERYIVSVENHVMPPKYLENPAVRFDIQGHSFHPLQDWPARNFYQLNESQMIAFQAAITQEFCIIQGPPGTGKTFLGLKIAHTLLANKKAWYNHTPMLVICYTNHALDQFLEGLLACTDRIMRVGSQSKNEQLQRFSLRNKSKFKMNPSVYQQRFEVQNILTQIKNITENLKAISSYRSIRDFSAFKDVIPNYSKTWFDNAQRHEIIDWLLGGIEGYYQKSEENQNLTGMEQGLNQIDINEDGDGQPENESSSDEDDVNDDDHVNDNDDDIFEEVLNASVVQVSFPLLLLNNLEKRIFELENNLATLHQNSAPTLQDLVVEDKYSVELFQSRNNYEYISMRLEEGKMRQSTKSELPKNANLNEPHKMNANNRWQLYFHWLNIYKAKLQEKLEVLNGQFRQAYKVYEQMRDIEDTNAMKDVLVVGMTTTSAARLRSSLQTLKSPVVIVEEAAEVLEAHIISSLTNHCNHLILIGDHQQLKPSSADFSVETNFKLGISLFERMVINNIQCYSLNVQHRMKPQIASLIVPTIYPFLQNHESTLNRKPITGIDQCLYFIDHEHQEANCEGTTKKNYHEVGFLISLARHLVLNGYKPEQITILAAYLGQMFEMQREKKKYKNVLDSVRIAVLDNYQGEECDIILLSLVRSNAENRIGFLKIENRVCVALSRARDGFYIMGNMKQLCRVSELWKKIKNTLEENDAIGPHLSLRCQVHSGTVTYVKEPRDFVAIAEGGCSEKCGIDLPCGHVCTSLCHVLNRDHQNYKCREECRKRLCDRNENHICKLMCYVPCDPCTYLVTHDLTCGHQAAIECHVDVDTYKCAVLIPSLLPCGHTVDKPCHCDPEVFRCPRICDSKVEPCGHACEMRCHIRKDPDHLEYKCKKRCARYRKNCTVQTEPHLCRKFCYEECDECTIPIKKQRTLCNHVDTIECCKDVDALICGKPCAKKLPCGHKCKKKCNEKCGICEVQVAKTLPLCKHEVKTKCHEPPNPMNCNRKCPLTLPCGHKCTKKCNETCTSDCKVMVDCSIRSDCGHTITKIKCSMSSSSTIDPKALMKYCNKPCEAKLLCEHNCSGTCGTCFQGCVHEKCGAKCGNILVCDHVCNLPCREACRPCLRKCQYQCVHSKCTKRCGEVCTPCKEQCPRRCVHQMCNNRCGDICTIKPCNEPCNKRLRGCGHPCIGFCGEPCPPKCLICDEEELLEAFLGYEDKEARYVYLEDCEHVIESEGMEMWLQQSKNDVSFKVCPRCKTAIKKTQRYSDFMKAAMADVSKVKTISNGTHQQNNETKNELQYKLIVLNSKTGLMSIVCPKVKEFLNMLSERLKESKKGKRQFINKFELNAVTSKMQILEHVVNICCNSKVSLTSSNEIFLPQVKFILKVLMREEDCITNQEISDIHFEINRLSRIVEYSQIKKSQKINDQKVAQLSLTIQNVLFERHQFTETNSQNAIKLLKQLNDHTRSGIGISEDEKRNILQAMGLSKGHWYKCPNGHVYAIGDCGGAMVEGKCSECGAKIGGQSHRLRADNALATEMDGARVAAWSEQANMANYDMRFL